MSHRRSTGSQTCVYAGIPWSFAKADIPKTGTSGDRTGHLYLLKCILSRVLKPIKLAKRIYELLTTSNFPGKTDAANVKDIFKEGKDLTTHSPWFQQPWSSDRRLSSPRAHLEELQGRRFWIQSLHIRKGTMGSHSGLRVDLGSSLDPAMSHITLDELPNSSEPEFAQISHMGMFWDLSMRRHKSPCLVTAHSIGAPFDIPGGSTFTHRARKLIRKIWWDDFLISKISHGALHVANEQ